MCSNYHVPSKISLRTDFNAPVPEFEYREDCYPGYAAPIVLAGDGDERSAPPATFGLIPFWAKDDRIVRQTYNARSETVATKNSFRDAWKRRQLCIVPVQAFYEPCYESGKPVRHRIVRQDGQPFGLAGIWSSWRPPEGPPRRSFAMLTIAAADHPIMQRMHAPEDEKRSVVVLDPDDYDDWLAARDETEVRQYLRLFDAEAFTAEAAPRPPRKSSPQQGLID